MNTATATETIGDLIDRLEAQASRRDMRAFLRRERRLHDPAVVESVYERVVRVARVDLQRAERLAEGAMWLADRLADKGCRAQGLRAMGHVLLIRGKYDDALERYNAALALFRTLGRTIDEGRTLSGGTIQSLISLGRYDEAYTTARQARRIFERHGDRLRLARLDSNIGNILCRQSRFRDALVLYQRAHAALAGIGDPQDVAAVLTNLAVCYTSLHDFARALDAYRDAREHCERHGLSLLVAQTDYNLAYVHYLRGEYTRALELYRGAQLQADHTGDAYHAALCDLDRSEIYLELNLNDAAGELAARALDRFDDLGTAYEAGKAMTNLAIAESREQRTANAVDLLQRARELFTRERNLVRLAWCDLYQAVVLHRAGEQGNAERLCRSALTGFRRAGLPAKAALCEILLARLQIEAGNLRAAERSCRAALKKIGQSPASSYQAYLLLGSIHETRRDLRAAQHAFERARGALESLRAHLQGDEQKVAFFEDKATLYEGLVSIALALGSSGHQEAAFDYIEHAKSRSLADLLVSRGTEAARDDTSELGERVLQVRAELNGCYRLIDLEEGERGGGSSAKVERHRRKARSLEHEMGRALRAVRANDEALAALPDATTFTADEIRSGLPGGTVVLEYYRGRGRIYVAVLSRERLDVVPLGDAARVEQTLRLLRFQLAKFRLGPGYVTTFAERLRDAASAHLLELHGALVAPIRDLLRADHLVVVPHGVLHHLPFHALSDGTRFLIDDFTMSYAPSATAYRLCSARPPLVGGRPLIMGVPDALTPNITEEVHAVASALRDSDLFMGSSATADRLRQAAPAAPLIHIATHGVFRHDNPMFSSIELGSGPLNVFDFYRLRMASDLVTLSGCSTGLNAVIGGDELLGLVRGLLYAGARTLMLSLWDVNDASTTEFMKGFYARLQAGLPKAKALQMTMGELRTRYGHPFYWAPFVLVGQAGP